MSTAGEHRADIDGLRSVAVLVVVAFHAGIAGFDGGFVGVDVFFVVSGYLIMGLLLREVDRSGSVSLRSFWSRRIRRLGPALLVVTLATLVATPFLVSPLRWRAIAVDSVWASTYLTNVALSLRADGYFVATASPFLHTWSLAVEEQFYLVWPLALALLARVGRGRPDRFRRSVIGFVTVGVVGSFALSVVATRRGAPWGFYLLPTRWWEIGLGIAVAVWGARHRCTGIMATLLATAGVISIAASIVLTQPITPFPGFAALPPTMGTAAILAAGNNGASPLSRWLNVAPVQWLGRLSYSWYLWHWPVLVLAADARLATGTAARVAVAAGSLIPATATHYLVEKPLRFNARLSGSLRWTAALLVGSILAVGVTAGGIVIWGERRLDDPFVSHLVDVVASRRAEGIGYCRSRGRQDLDACRPGTGTVMLIGDSHAQHWRPVLEEVADELDRPLAIRTVGGCPQWDLDVTVTGKDRPAPLCQRFRQGTWQEIERIRPAVVIVAGASYEGMIVRADGGIAERDEEARLWEEAATRTFRRIRSAGAVPGVILDTPIAPFDPIDCLASEGAGDRCTFGRSEALEPVATSRRAQRAAAEADDVRTLDATDTFCGPSRCAAMIGKRVVLADPSHLAPEFVTTLRSTLTSFVRQLEAGR